MTMVTASTALTIFIMNIHHCGPEARPVPQWAERFVLNYLARVCFVYEVGQNCLGGKQTLSQGESEAPSANGGSAKGTNWEVNGEVWGGRADEDGASLTLGRDVTPDPCEEDLFVTVDHSEDGGAAKRGGVGQAESVGAGPGGEEVAEGKTGLGGARESRGEVLGKGQCVCQHQGVHRDIEYIASSYQEQRATQLRVGEWRKVAKVMDRFFMWLFFIMVVFTSILILGKAI